MSPRRAAFTLVELLAAVVIVGILVSLLVTGGQKARSAADSAKCLANLRASGHAMLQYFQDNNTEFFPGKNWFQYPSTKAKPNSGMLDYFWPGSVSPTENAATGERFRQDTILTCPAMKRKYPHLYPQSLNRGFAINYYLNQKNPSNSSENLSGAPQRLMNVSRPSAMWILTEAPVNGGLLGSLNENAASHADNFMSLPHGGRQNVCFLDGHIESLDREAFVNPSNPRAFWGNLNLPETPSNP